MGESVLAAARKLLEGTPSPRNFDRGDHRRLLKSGGAHRTGNRIVKILLGHVNKMLGVLVLTNEQAERIASGLVNFDTMFL
jgi:hypothetical protein